MIGSDAALPSGSSHLNAAGAIGLNAVGWSGKIVAATAACWKYNWGSGQLLWICGCQFISSLAKASRGWPVMMVEHIQLMLGSSGLAAEPNFEMLSCLELKWQCLDGSLAEAPGCCLQLCFFVVMPKLLIQQLLDSGSCGIDCCCSRLILGCSGQILSSFFEDVALVEAPAGAAVQ
ncbi:hypothetical protein Nepgr_033564 [Nepenthes gracilis]|uniref:Uncharacterized protein n=1 Tax=Nepenthes gracilis TaxID=150966 RepID=A0AAD3TLE8_NEPGR|nr:hypothetical protein Nepgr_033564 [Nepenthes gracilis]